MQLSEKAYNEKIEEFSSSSNMHYQEREKLTQKLKECEAQIEMLKKSLEETQSCEKAALESINKENAELKAQAKELQRNLEEDTLNEKYVSALEEKTVENKRLADILLELTEEKNRFLSQNSVLASKIDKSEKQNSKLCDEIVELKKAVSALKIVKRNFAMDTNSKVFEYEQKQLLDIENINARIAEISEALSTMKSSLSYLIVKTKIDPNEGEDILLNSYST